MRPCRLTRLAWSDEALGTIELPARLLVLRASFGSGLTTRPGDPPGIVWGVGDRGPNLKIGTLVRRYGLESMRRFADEAGAKVMPRLDLGPRIARFRVEGESVRLEADFALRDGAGRPVSGRPIPGGAHSVQEPALDLDGAPLAPDPGGLDTEGMAASADGGFWIGDEFGPSLVRVDAEGKVLLRAVPEGTAPAGAGYKVRPVLPAIAARRQINRGFEAIASSPDGKWLYLAFQSPLAHPGEEAHRRARHIRLWRLDAATLEVAEQHLYPLDPPDSFARDAAREPVSRGDIKVGEMAWIGENILLLLERVTHSSRIYRVELGEATRLPAAHLDIATRPTLEELSARGTLDIPVLAKTCMLDSDRFPELPPDLEGMAVLGPNALLLVTDNDFGVEGAETEFWRAEFDAPLAG